MDAASQKLMTFITPMGRYCFGWLPFSITLAPEIFQRQMSIQLKDHDGVVVVMDDYLCTEQQGKTTTAVLMQSIKDNKGQ